MRTMDSSKPYVSMDLPLYLNAFCRFIFNTPPEDDAIEVNRLHDIGKLIHSNIQACEFPVKKYEEGSTIFILPINQENAYPMNSNFLTLTTWGRQKIKDGLEYEYRKWIARRFEMGYERGYAQKDIVYAILRALNLRDNAVNFDGIKKIDYRNRRKMSEIRFFELLKDDI